MCVKNFFGFLVVFVGGNDFIFFDIVYVLFWCICVVFVVVVCGFVSDGCGD